MRKSLIAILLPVVLVSCDKLSQINGNEITLTPRINCMETRGYVEGAAMEDSDPVADRVIYLSAYDVTDARNHFTGGTFRLSEGQWRNFEGGVAVPKNWVIGHTLRFLAYSASCAPAAVWQQDRNCGKVELYVTQASLQDDLLYGRTEELSNDGAPVEMAFSHSQAWIEVQISSAYATPVTINKVTIRDVRTEGRLTIDNTGSAVVCSWDFSGTSAVGCTLEPQDGKASVLLPAQPAGGIDVDYSVAGAGRKVAVTSAAAVWTAGVHYIYKVMLSPGVEAAAVSPIQVEY